MSQPVLGYWAIRGLGQHIRLLLKYIGLDFEDRQYEFGKGEDDSDWMALRKYWDADKFALGLEFPNLPYWIDGDVKLTESRVILKYIATVYGKNIVPQGAKEEARAEMIIGHTSDIHRNLGNFAYGTKFPVEMTLEQWTDKPLEILAKFLGSKEWMLGDNISYVDFFVYEVLKQYTKFRSDFLKAQPMLEAYVRKFEALPQLKEYIASTEHLRCYTPFAIHQF